MLCSSKPLAKTCCCVKLRPPAALCLEFSKKLEAEILFWSQRGFGARRRKLGKAGEEKRPGGYSDN
jgi:hypothetical protein